MSSTEPTIPPTPPAPPSSSFAPLKQKLFFVLWTATVLGNVGSFVRDVASSWLMTDLSSSPTAVALVQAACVGSWRTVDEGRRWGQVDVGKLRHPANVDTTRTVRTGVDQFQHPPCREVPLGAGQPIEPYGFREISGSTVATMVGAGRTVNVLRRTVGIRVASLSRAIRLLDNADVGLGGCCVRGVLPDISGGLWQIVAGCRTQA